MRATPNAPAGGIVPAAQATRGIPAEEARTYPKCRKAAWSEPDHEDETPPAMQLFVAVPIPIEQHDHTDATVTEEVHFVYGSGEICASILKLILAGAMLLAFCILIFKMCQS